MQPSTHNFTFVAPSCAMNALQNSVGFGGNLSPEVDQRKAHGDNLLRLSALCANKSATDSFVSFATSGNEASGIFFTPFFMLDTKEGAQPMLLDRLAAAPGELFKNSENLLMAELSKRSTQESSERETKMPHDSCMENSQDIRRKRLTQWMGERRLSQVDVAARTKKSRAYVSLVLSAGKSFGEKTARAFEKALFMPHLWLDGEAEPQEPSKHSTLGELLAEMFDSLSLEEPLRTAAYAEATQVLISYSVRSRTLPTALPDAPDSGAKPSESPPPFLERRKVQPQK